MWLGLIEVFVDGCGLLWVTDWWGNWYSQREYHLVLLSPPPNPKRETVKQVNHQKGAVLVRWISRLQSPKYCALIATEYFKTWSFSNLTAPQVIEWKVVNAQITQNSGGRQSGNSSPHTNCSFLMVHLFHNLSFEDGEFLIVTDRVNLLWKKTSSTAQ